MAIPEYANEAGAPAVQAVGCPQCGVRRGERCIVKAGFAGTRPAPRLHTKRVKDYLNNASSSPVEPEAFPPSSGSTIDDGIIVGDCLSVMAEMPDGSVDLAITSPPYNALNSSGGGWKNCRGKWEAASDGIYDVHDDAMPVDEYIEWQRNCLAEMMRVVSEDGAIFYFHRRRVQQDVQEDHAADILEIAPAFGFAVRQTIIWARAGGFNSNPGYLLPSQEQIYLLAKPGRFRHDGLGRIPDVFHLPAVSALRGTDLPPQFPVEIPRTLLAAIRPEPRRAGAYGLALDPFGGSGTVAEAAVLEGWDYIHIDISPAYCAYARQRVAAVMATSDDTPQSDTPQSTDTPQSDTPQQEPAPWANSLPLWNATDKAAYNHIQAAQGGHLQSVPLVQADIAAAIGKKERTVSTSVNKLKAHRCISVYSARKGASLYSTTSEIPRWPAKVAGGIGSGPVDTPQSTDTPQSDTPQSTDTPQSDTPQSTDTPQSDTPQSTDTPQSDTPQQEPAPWANSLPLWNATDKAVYNHIQAAQGGHLQSVPLVQADIAAAIGKKERTVSTSVNKLKAHRCISVYSARKGASLYSTTSEIPRWPAKVAGGIGSGASGYPAINGYSAVGYPAINGYSAVGYPAINGYSAVGYPAVFAASAPGARGRGRLRK